MSDRNRSAVRSRISLTGIFGILLLVAGIAAIAENAFACDNCNCYYTSDCASGKTCNRSSGCREWSANGKRVDGTCTASGASELDGGLAAEALDLWLRAYEDAGLRGGEPNASLVAQALALPLTPAQHAAIRDVAIDAQIVLFGASTTAGELAGLFDLPRAEKRVAILCDATLDQTNFSAKARVLTENGALPRLDSDRLELARLVREAMVAKVRDASDGEQEAAALTRTIQKSGIPITSGRCADSGQSVGRFPFKSGADCLSREALAVAGSLVSRAERERVNGSSR